MSETILGLSQASYGESKPEAKPYFFEVSLLKLIVMSTVTFNLYQIYWFYKNWRMAKDRGEDVLPVPRAIFGVLFAYALFKEVREIGRSAGVSVAVNAGGLAFLFFVLQATWRLRDPLWLLGFISVLPLAIVQNDIMKVHRALGVSSDPNSRFTWLNIVGVVVGGLWIVLALIGTFIGEGAG